MQLFALVVLMVLLFPLKGNAQQPPYQDPQLNFTIDRGLQLTTNTVATLVVSALNTGDATVVVSDDLTLVRPSSVRNALKVDVTVAGTIPSAYQIDWNINIPLTGVNTLCFAYYFTPTVTTGWSNTMYIAETSAYAIRYQWNPMNVYPNVVKNGWNLVTLDMNTPSTTSGAVDRAHIHKRLRMQLNIPASATGAIYISPVFLNCNTAPKVAFVFDDNGATQYTEAFKYLDSKRLKGSLAIQTGLVGVSGMTGAQIQDVYAKGWSVHNHTTVHTDYTTLTQAQVLADFLTAQDVLNTLGTTYGSRTFVYPLGATNATVELGLGQAGVTHGLVAGNDMIESVWDGFANPYRIQRVAIINTTPLATTLAKVNDLLRFGGAIILYCHDIVVGAAGTQAEKATFRGVVDAVAQLHYSGKLEVMPVQELINAVELRRTGAANVRRIYPIQ